MACTGLHFIPADNAFQCSECETEQPANSLLMVYRERLVPRVFGVGVRAATRYLCEDCGKLLLESL